MRTRAGRLRNWAAILVVAAVIVPSVAFAAQAEQSGSPTRYEQTSSKIVYLGTWVTFKGSGISAGSYKYANAPATALVWFNGTQLDLIATKGYTMGKAQVTLDGGAPIQVNLYNPTTLRQQKVWSTGALPPGLHRVALSWTGQRSVASGGTRVNIDALDVVGTLTQAALTTIQEKDTRLSYAGTWAPSSTSLASGGSLYYTRTSGATAIVAFNGTDVRYLAKTAPDNGRVKLTLDKRSPVYVDLYSSSTTYRKVVWSAFGLAAGDHSLRIEWTGQKNSRARGTAVNVDALLVAESPVLTASSTDTAQTIGTTTTTAAPTTTTKAAPAVTTTTLAPPTTTAVIPTTTTLAPTTTTILSTAAASTTTTVAPTTTTLPPTTTTAVPSTTTTLAPTTTTTTPATTAALPTTTGKNVTRDFGSNNLAGNATDESSKLQAIINASAAGDTLYFPAGTYLASSGVTFKDGVNVSGDGAGSWIEGVIRPGSSMSFANLKLGIDVSRSFGYSGGSHVTHHLTCRNVTFVGGVAFEAGSQDWDGSLHDSLFDHCTFVKSASGSVYNSVNLYVYGKKSTNTHYNIDFRSCTFEGSKRINVEITCYAGDPSMNFAYAWRNINFYNCYFGPSGMQNLSLCGRRMGYWQAPYSGDFQCGYGIMSGCTIADAGLVGPGNAGIELGGTRAYTITGTTIKGSHVGTMLDVNPDALDHKWRAGYNNDQYNVITSNIFDGTSSPESNLTINGNHLTFSGNTVIQRICQGFMNIKDSTIENNEFRTVNADGTLSTTRHALMIADADNIVLKGNTFKSRYDHTTIVSTDYNAPTGPATNIQFTNNTFVKDAGDNPVYIASGSSATVTGSMYVIP